MTSNGLNPIRNNRILSDIKELVRNDMPDIIEKVEINEDIYKPHIIYMKGPVDTPYEGGIFKISMQMPADYPYKPPSMSFMTQVYHPNISRDGSICIDILKDQWSSVLRATKVILSLSALLANPNPDDPLVLETAREYRDDRKKYETNAREWVNKFAKANK